MMRRPFLLFLVLLVLVTSSGIQVARVSHQVRELHGELEMAQKTQDRYLSAYSRLLLERGALSSYQNVERLAEGKLAMHFPSDVEQVIGHAVVEAGRR
jgi:cell division protein FtsL